MYSPVLLTVDHHIQHSGLRPVLNDSHFLITGGTFVSLSCRLYVNDFTIIVHRLALTTIMSIISLLMPAKCR